MKPEKLCFKPFPISSLKPEGWLLKQLQIQAAGLSGNLDTFWSDIKDSAWIGGKAEGWERMPYWLDGAIPLAWLINDEPLKNRLKNYIDYIIEHQHSDGWLGPRVEEKSQAADVWSQMLALKVLSVYYDASGDTRSLAAIEKALLKLDRHIDTAPLFNWGQFRWFETLIAIWQLYEITEKDWLINLAVKLHAQGFNWKDFFTRWPLEKPTEPKRWNYAGHVVNNAMALKSSALWFRLTGDKSDKDAVFDMMKKLDEHHGVVSGVFTGDECLAGTSAIQGTELCAVVEYMYSLEILLSVFGDAVFGDRLERIAFNALPATFSPDMWSHQYDQQINQIECSVNSARCWTTNEPDANIFGLEPNYGCCTANLSQGWPKFAAHLWMRSGDNGIAAAVYAPSTVETEIDGVNVSITLKTDYPFKDKLHFNIIVEKPVSFPLYLRIPEWAGEAEIKINGESGKGGEFCENRKCCDNSKFCAGDEQVEKIGKPVKGEFFKINRLWKTGDKIELALPMHAVIERRQNNAVSVIRGPLVYSLKIEEEWRRINIDKPGRELPHGDFEVYPVSPWNYALKIDEKKLDEGIIFEEHEIKDEIFSPECAPVTARAGAVRVPEWKAENGSAGELPKSPVKTDSQPEEITLIPYGCTNLRITEFPVTE